LAGKNCGPKLNQLMAAAGKRLIVTPETTEVLR